MAPRDTKSVGDGVLVVAGLARQITVLLTCVTLAGGIVQVLRRRSKGPASHSNCERTDNGDCGREPVSPDRHLTSPFDPTDIGDAGLVDIDVFSVAARSLLRIAVIGSLLHQYERAGHTLINAQCAHS